INKDCTVADKLQFSVTSSLRRSVRGWDGIISNRQLLQHILSPQCSSAQENSSQLDRVIYAEWLRNRQASYADGEIYHGRPLVPYADCLNWVPIPSELSSKVKDICRRVLLYNLLYGIKEELDEVFLDASGCMKDMATEMKKKFDKVYTLMHYALWKKKSSKYKILSKMAAEILAIPLTTVASESAFSAGGRVIDPHRSSLGTNIVDMLILWS
ncbi:zinc finger BED domain-containing protein RICESLEEPER 2-like protein, partial [Tanacetum coccineum]